MAKITQQVQDKMTKTAALVRENAYAPYSNFKVGAAILFEDGSIEAGCNVENASYGLTICAERVAMTAAVAKGKRKATAVVVVTDTNELVYPCGACRQFLAEFNGDMQVISATVGGKLKSHSLSQLLPEQFSRASLTQSVALQSGAT